jgi:L-asparagine transporter-like permease
VLLPILLSAVLVVAAWVFLWNLASLVAVLTWAALVLATWPLRAGLRRYGKGLRDARMHP